MKVTELEVKKFKYLVSFRNAINEMATLQSDRAEKRLAALHEDEAALWHKIGQRLNLDIVTKKYRVNIETAEIEEVI